MFYQGGRNEEGQYRASMFIDKIIKLIWVQFSKRFYFVLDGYIMIYY